MPMTARAPIISRPSSPRDGLWVGPSRRSTPNSPPSFDAAVRRQRRETSPTSRAAGTRSSIPGRRDRKGNLRLFATLDVDRFDSRSYDRFSTA